MVTPSLFGGVALLIVVVSFHWPRVPICSRLARSNHHELEGRPTDPSATSSGTTRSRCRELGNGQIHAMGGAGGTVGKGSGLHHGEQKRWRCSWILYPCSSFLWVLISSMCYAILWYYDFVLSWMSGTLCSWIFILWWYMNIDSVMWRFNSWMFESILGWR